jgi:dolichol-phosphate mannosyltransferase
MLFICFSAYNEEHNIEPLLRRISTQFSSPESYQVIAYNDGSHDQTLAALERCKDAYPLVVLHSDENRGLGEGTNQLVHYICAYGTDSDIAVFMDGDDTHDPSVIPGMCAAIANGADVVIASRYCPGKIATGLSWQRHAISFAASVFWRVMLPIAQVKDYTCGFRAYRVGVLKQAVVAKGGSLISRRGFECQVELLNALKPYARFSEVPINLVYNRKQGASKMRIMRTSMRTLSLGIHLLAQRCLGTKQG